MDPEHPVRGGSLAPPGPGTDVGEGAVAAEHEVVVLGAGPAGCAAATLLARRAHRVALVRPASTPAGELAESVPPSANKLLRELGLFDAVEAAGFQPNLGNTVWWAGRPARVEPFPDGQRGVHVERRALESVLVRAAEAAGVRVHDGFAAREARESVAGWTVACRARDGRTLELRAPWLLDATGRRGFLARREGRERDAGPATLALLARFRRPDGWPVADGAAEGHTLVESWQDGWAWSVPLDGEVRCFAAMVDKARGGGTDVVGAFHAAIARAARLGALVAGAEPAGRVWACSASLYSARRFARRSGAGGMLLVGDAGSFIDPLSSFGVKKALSSGWLAGVVAHTALVDPPLADTAIDFFDRREREVWRRYRALSTEFCETAASAHSTSFWRDRIAAAGATSRNAVYTTADPDRIAPEIPAPEVRRAFEILRSRPSMDAGPGPTLRHVRRPAVEGHRIAMQDQLASERCPEGLRYVRGVDLVRLVGSATAHAQVPDAWTAYNAVAAPVSLPDFLTALATAFAAGFLAHREG